MRIHMDPYLSLSSSAVAALEFTERLIGGNGGLVRLKSPIVELNGVRIFVPRLFAGRERNGIKSSRPTLRLTRKC